MPTLPVAMSPISLVRASRAFQRPFSVSRQWRLHTKEMDEELLGSLKVNQSRLMEDIHYTCQWGKGERWGEYVNIGILYLVQMLSLLM